MAKKKGESKKTEKKNAGSPFFNCDTVYTVSHKKSTPFLIITPLVSFL